MENNSNNKYLIIIALIDGQNFTVPSGAPERIEATVFAEARFGNESVLRSDPIKLTNSNPEFITELAWQLDRRSLHQLRVERKAIKLQVFMQTRERKRTQRLSSDQSPTSSSNESHETHKVELIGYTILDLRSAQQREQPKFKWFPLLNPKFRKPSYNRPEIQLAVTLNYISDDGVQDAANQFSSISSLPDGENRDESLEFMGGAGANELEGNRNTTSPENSSSDTRLFTTCLDVTNKTDKSIIINDEIIDNDIIIRSKEGVFYIYDARNPHKNRLEDCDDCFELTITIPFTTGLDLIVGNGHKHQEVYYYFSTHLFGSTFRTNQFKDLLGQDAKEMVIYLQTTHPAVLATYFELNSNLDIKFHRSSGQMIAMSTIQLNQICSLDLKCRSIEGIFMLQPANETEGSEQYASERINPTMGVSVVLEKIESFASGPRPSKHRMNAPLQMPININGRADSFGCDGEKSLTQDDRSYQQLTHQLTMDNNSSCAMERSENNEEEEEANLKNQRCTSHEILVKDQDGPSDNDHHYCFTIDLKKFSYTPSQRLIPTLRELIIRYSYPFFGYKDTIQTDASIPINATSSIIVSGFCEFNFATTSGPLLTALTEIPLDLEILVVDESRLKDIDTSGCVERIVATCSIRLAKLLELNGDSLNSLLDNPLSKSTSIPIYALDGDEIGQVQVFLCLKDLGKPTQKFKASVENLLDNFNDLGNHLPPVEPESPSDSRKLDAFIADTRKHFDLWRDEYFDKLADEIRRRDNDRFKRLYQRIEAKDTRRDQEFKRKMDDLSSLETKFKASLACVESLERMLSDSLDHLKNKNVTLDARLSAIESKLQQVILISSNGGSGGGGGIGSTGGVNSLVNSGKQHVQAQATSDNSNTITRIDKSVITKSSTQNGTANDARLTTTAARRSSSKSVGSPTAGSGLPAPIRSTSLVRRPSEGNTVTKIVRRETVSLAPQAHQQLNGISHSPASRIVKAPLVSSVARLNLSKESQEKLVGLRKRKAELLKRGCKPSDELIQEINSFIEKLTC